MTVLAAIGHHLWQSTVFAALVGLTTLAFRRNRAAVRHGLWLAASIKFLVPFAALVALGGALGLRAAPPAAHLARQIVIVVESDSAEPPLRAGDVASPSSLVPTASPIWRRLIPIGAGVWLAGVIVIVAAWTMRWRRVAAIARGASTIDAGRHVDALRRLERLAERKRPIAFVSSEASLEPGVFGILRPVLLWPTTIADRLNDDQIAAILAHELSHVRRRDNLAAAIHMLVEALFWFHPLVWWIGARLVDERERACDEAVLELGSEPETYAETILKACRIFVESPLACVAGVTGSDLSRRIERIVTGPGGQALTAWRKAVLAGLALVAVGAPIVLGAAAPPRSQITLVEQRVTRLARRVQASETRQSASAQPQFEVASVRPNRSDIPKVTIQTLPGGRFTATNVTLRALILYAYDLQPAQLVYPPGWFNSDRFDIVAKGEADADGLSDEQLGQPSRLRLMLRTLLAERFKLALRAESRELPIYALVIARKDGKLGSQIKPSATDCHPLDSGGGAEPCGITIGGGAGTMVVRGASLTQIANNLSSWVGRLVVDRTGLAGSFDLTLSWTPDQLPQGFDKKIAARALTPADPNGPSIFTAIQEQLGLKLESQKAPVDVFSLERAEHPIEN